MITTPLSRLLIGSLALLAAGSLSPAPSSAQQIHGTQTTLPATERSVTVEYFRAPGEARRPSVLMLHGGQGWGGAEGRIDTFRRYGGELARHGFDAYMVYYYSDQDIADRQAGPPGQVSIRRFPDWAKLVSDLTARVKAMPSSNGRVGLVGFSNGGNLSAHATPLDQNIDSAVVYYGGVSRVPGYEAKRFPPLLILHGEADTQEPIARGYALLSAANKVRADVQFHSYPGVGHGFAPALDTPAAQDALTKTLAFFDRTLNTDD